MITDELEQAEALFPEILIMILYSDHIVITIILYYIQC